MHFPALVGLIPSCHQGPRSRSLVMALALTTAATAAALRLPTLTNSHPPALLAPCTAGRRCASICALIDDDSLDDENLPTSDDDMMMEIQRSHF